MPDGRYLSNGNAQSYLGYTEQETLKYYKSSHFDTYNNPMALQKVIERYLK